MIKTLEIQNFKSVKQLKLDCARINVLIGGPNTGKSNVLEALGMFSFAGHPIGNRLSDFVRFEQTTNLFYDENLEEPVVVQVDGWKCTLRFKQGTFTGEVRLSPSSAVGFQGGYDDLQHTTPPAAELAAFKFYRFTVQSEFARRESEYLLPPKGENLMSLIQGHREFRKGANQFFAPLGLRLNLRPQENKMEVIKPLDDITISFPYSLASDTLQRVIFHMFAILSNSNSVLVFEEPESHAFPYHTKYLAESIALDPKGNQYFIATHNPYLLLPILQKAPAGDVAIFVTYFEDYQTKVKPLTAEEKEEIMEIDVFSNLDRFVEVA